MQNAKCKMQNVKCKMQNAKCKMQNAKLKSIFSVKQYGYAKIIKLAEPKTERSRS